MYFPKLFRTLGWSIFALGIVPPAIGMFGEFILKEAIFGLDEENSLILMAGMMVLGSIFLAIGSLIRNVSEVYIRREGEEAIAKILKVKRTNDRINHTNTTIYLLLEVQPTGKSPFTKEIMTVVQMWGIPQEGDVVKVKCIPERKKVALVYK